MNHNPVTLSPAGCEYVSPASRVIPLIPENAICDSPVSGGNEDIGYEDWD